jgi:hypothetical protein
MDTELSPTAIACFEGRPQDDRTRSFEVVALKEELLGIRAKP